MSDEEFQQKLDDQFPSGKIYHEPEFWADSRFNHPSQPVVGITWFEARAYVNWLSAQSDKAIVLPTEAEWEAVASGRKGRVYPYGQEYDRLKGNTFETHLHQTTSVGVFVEGQTPEGIFDLSGNVFEWTSTLYQPYPYNSQDGREGTAASEARVLRGGSFDHHPSNARVAYRYLGHSIGRNNNYGFRVCVRVHSPSSLT